MKTFSWISLILCLTTLQGCRKEYTVTGRVFNVVTDEGIPNVEVVFSRNIKTTTAEAKKTFNAFTNENGDYSILTKANIRKSHKVTFNGMKDTNYFLVGNYDVGLFQKTNNYRIELGVARILSANFFYQDSSYASVSPEKELRVSFRHASVNGFYLPGEFVLRNSLVVSPPSNNYAVLEGWTYIEGRSIRENSVEIIFKDSIYVPGKNSNVVNHYRKY